MIAGQIQRRNKYLRLLGINIAFIVLMLGVTASITPKGNEILTGILTVILAVAVIIYYVLIVLVFGAYMKAKGYPELGILAIFGPVVWLVFWLLPDKTVGQADNTGDLVNAKSLDRRAYNVTDIDELVSEYGNVLEKCGDMGLTFKPQSWLPADSTVIQDALKKELASAIADNDEKAVETIVVCYMFLEDFMRDDIALGANEFFVLNAKRDGPANPQSVTLIYEASAIRRSQSEILANDWNSFLETLSGDEKQIALIELARVKRGNQHPVGVTPD